MILTLPQRTLIKIRAHEKISATQWNVDQKLAKSSSNGLLELNDFLMFLKREVLKAYFIQVSILEYKSSHRVQSLYIMPLISFCKMNVFIGSHVNYTD